MSQVVPDQLELEVINTLLTPALTIRLYGNNKTPAHGDTAGSYTEISGGGYTSFPLTFVNWGIAAGEPTQAIYNAAIAWAFTAAINAPGTIYGYYVTRDSDGHLMWAERFGAGIVPFSPIAGSLIRVLPAFSVQSQF
jgi:hypothetical protein